MSLSLICLIESANSEVSCLAESNASAAFAEASDILSNFSVGLSIALSKVKKSAVKEIIAAIKGKRGLSNAATVISLRPATKPFSAKVAAIVLPANNSNAVPIPTKALPRGANGVF